VLQRADEVSTILRMLADAQTSTLALTGDPGAGKSTLAALLYRRLEAAARAGQVPMRHFAWLSLGPNATLPDVIAALLGRIDVARPDFFMSRPEEQIALLVQALRRPQESAFVVLDQFEELLELETDQELAGRGAISLFLDILQRDLGASRVLLTCRNSPYNTQNGEDVRVRLADREVIGRFEAIDQAGSLVLRLPDGKTTTVAAADVFMLPAPTSGKAS